MTLVRFRALGSAGILLVALAGCSDGEPAKPRTAQSPAASSPQAVDVTPDPVIDTGQRLLVTDAAVLPRELLADVGQPVEFRNAGTTPMVVKLIVGSVTSPTVPPGSSWSWTPDALGTFGFSVDGGQPRRGTVSAELPD